MAIVGGRRGAELVYLWWRLRLSQNRSDDVDWVAMVWSTKEDCIGCPEKIPTLLDTDWNYLTYRDTAGRAPIHQQ